MSLHLDLPESDPHMLLAYKPRRTATTTKHGRPASLLAPSNSHRPHVRLAFVSPDRFWTCATSWWLCPDGTEGSCWVRTASSTSTIVLETYWWRKDMLLPRWDGPLRSHSFSFYWGHQIYETQKHLISCRLALLHILDLPQHVPNLSQQGGKNRPWTGLTQHSLTLRGNLESPGTLMDMFMVYLDVSAIQFAVLANHVKL